MPTISAPRAIVDGRLTGPVTVSVTDGVIREVRHHDVRESAPSDADVTLSDGVLTAGLVDIQINGAFGVDFCSADDEGWDRVATALTTTGVTAFQPTYITAPLGALVSGLHTAIEARTRQAGTGSARIMGVHLEGPFLSPIRHGVHEARYLIEPTPEAVDRLLNAPGREILTMVTLAPELPGGLDAVRRFAQAGIRVSVGHTDAVAAQIIAAADAGATLVTHIFNAQRGLAHREPGVPGATMADHRFYCGLIADLHHVAPEICGLIWKGARGRVVLVTDAIAAAGMPPGAYELSGIPVRLGEDGVPRNADGTIAGSALTLDQAVRNMISLGLPVAQVVEAASRIPADALGRTDLGRIAVGAKADLVWWSDDFHPRRTWVDGREAQAPTTASAALPAAREPLAVSP